MTVSATQTRTETSSITLSDGQKVLEQVEKELLSLPRLFKLTPDFSLEAAIQDINILVLREIISEVRLQLYIGQELVREYRFTFVTGTLDSFGPPADQPPIGEVPPGTRLRLTVTHNLKTPQDRRRQWFDRLGWTTGERLAGAENAHSHLYGRFTSGGFTAERQLLINPKFDTSTPAEMIKEKP